MSAVTQLLIRLHMLRTDCRAVTALEYGLIASLIAIAIVGATATLGGNLTAEFNYIATEI